MNKLKLILVVGIVANGLQGMNHTAKLSASKLLNFSKYPTIEAAINNSKFGIEVIQKNNLDKSYTFHLAEDSRQNKRDSLLYSGFLRAFYLTKPYRFFDKQGSEFYIDSSLVPMPLGHVLPIMKFEGDRWADEFFMETAKKYALGFYGQNPEDYDRAYRYCLEITQSLRQGRGHNGQIANGIIGLLYRQRLIEGGTPKDLEEGERYIKESRFNEDQLKRHTTVNGRTLVKKEQDTFFSKWFR